MYHLYIKPNYVSSIRDLPGPPNASVITGNLYEVLREDSIVAHGRWAQLYGNVYRYRYFFGRDRIVISDDAAALEHILFKRQDIYGKPSEINAALERVAGNGLLTSEGDLHKRMRKVSSAAFSSQRVDEYIDVFISQTDRLCERIKDACSTRSASGSGEWTVLQMFPFLNRHALAVISIAGFGFDIEKYEAKEQNLIEALQRVLDPTKVTPWTWLVVYTAPYLPYLDFLPVPLLVNMRNALSELQSDARDIIDEANERLASGQSGKRNSLIDSLLMSNRSEKVKDRLNDTEVMAQVTTFVSKHMSGVFAVIELLKAMPQLAAGNETVSTSIAWYLLELSKNEEVQEKLRQELRNINLSNAAEIHRLAYLDAVTREVLRLHPAIGTVMRASTVPDVLPLSRPYVNASGDARDTLHISARQEIVINVARWNRSETIFGPDANVFKPERWLDQSGEKLMSTDSARNMSVYRPLLTFIGGNRSCIGYRFALLEMKVAVARLVTRFQFGDTGADFFPLGNISSRMAIRGKEKMGVQLPLKVRSLPHRTWQ